MSVVFVELSSGAGTGRALDPEAIREVVVGALAAVVDEVEGFGGKVTSMSSNGVLAIFGAPDAHEDDPERALRAAFRVLNGADAVSGELTLRAGVETGPAVTGPLGVGSGGHYGAVGDVMSTAGALQLAARPGSVLVGPITRRATEGLFEWARRPRWPCREARGELRASYLGRPITGMIGRPAPRGDCQVRSDDRSNTRARPFSGCPSGTRQAGAAASSS